MCTIAVSEKMEESELYWHKYWQMEIIGKKGKENVYERTWNHNHRCQSRGAVKARQHECGDVLGAWHARI